MTHRWNWILCTGSCPPSLLMLALLAKIRCRLHQHLHSQCKFHLWRLQDFSNLQDANGTHNGAQQTPKLPPGSKKKTNASSWNVFSKITLQETNISYLGKFGKSSSNMPNGWGYVIQFHLVPRYPLSNPRCWEPPHLRLPKLMGSQTWVHLPLGLGVKIWKIESSIYVVKNTPSILFR